MEVNYDKKIDGIEYAYYSKINAFKYLPKNFTKLFWLRLLSMSELVNLNF